MIDKSISYNIGMGGIIEGELILISPKSEKAMLSKIEREHKLYKLDRKFVNGANFIMPDNPALKMWVFPLQENTIYELRNYLLKDGEIVKTGYIIIHDNEVVELEYEQILTFIKMLSSDAKYKDLRQKSDNLVSDQKDQFAPDDIDF